jgi:hypothetical protein
VHLVFGRDSLHAAKNLERVAPGFPARKGIERFSLQARMNSILKVEEGSMVVIPVLFAASLNKIRNKPGLWSNWVVVSADTSAMIDWVTSEISRSILAT